MDLVKNLLSLIAAPVDSSGTEAISCCKALVRFLDENFGCCGKAAAATASLKTSAPMMLSRLVMVAAPALGLRGFLALA